MKIELRNVKHAAFASQETPCMSATVYLDGKRAGEVSNDGYGGCYLFSDDETLRRLNEYGATLPAEKFAISESETVEIKQNSETLIGAAFNDWALAKELKRLLSKRILWVRDGGIYQTQTLDATRRDALLASPTLLRKQLKTEQILNLLPADDALRVYRELATA